MTGSILAAAIIEQMNDGEVQIYAGDGTGVRKVNDLLSDSQMEEIERKLIGYLEDLISDVTESLGEENDE